MRQEYQMNETPSTIVTYTNLFTIESNDPVSNRYIDMFYLWWASIIKYGQTDHLMVMCDKRTYQYMSNTQVFQTLKTQVRCRMTILLYDPPKTIKEGMLNRYKIDMIYKYNPPEQTIFLYLDVDVLVKKPLSGLFTDIIHTNSLYLSGETIITDEKHMFLDNIYFGNLAQKEDIEWIEKNFPNESLPGITSGIFAFTDSIHIRNFFEWIITTAQADNRSFETIDQPYFNAAIYKLLMRERLIRATSFNHIYIQPNSYSIQVPDAILLNFCGTPADQSSHWWKILEEILIQILVVDMKIQK